MSYLEISWIPASELLLADLLHVLLFNPVDGGDLIIQNVTSLSPHYIALYPRMQKSSM
jgi:hypothetical protein